MAAESGWAHIDAKGQPDAFTAVPPAVFGSITGFDLADAATQASNGWYPVVEVRPIVSATQTLDGPTYALDGENLVATYTVRNITADEAAEALQAALSVKLTATAAEYAKRVGAGYAYTPAGATAPLIIDIDDGSRANLGGLALSAALTIMGVQPWSAELQKGWVARGGARILLPTPQDALPLANGAAGYYSALVQYEQDLADAAQAATDVAAVNAVDQTAGWPTA